MEKLEGGFSGVKKHQPNHSMPPHKGHPLLRGTEGDKHLTLCCGGSESLLIDKRKVSA